MACGPTTKLWWLCWAWVEDDEIEADAPYPSTPNDAQEQEAAHHHN